MTNQVTRLAEEAKRLLTVATNASFDCGAWGSDEELVQSYEPFLEASTKARQDMIDAIDALAALAQPAVSEDAELLDWFEKSSYGSFRIEYEGPHVGYSISNWDDTLLGGDFTIRGAIKNAMTIEAARASSTTGDKE